jgi:alkanesulfonate monooxygenase SsuD/methylene tetrahydromethanopterin reductase-like flavin-dependent oxidoreductase (luciferase family)
LEDVSSYEGTYVHFQEVRSYPKPFRGRRLPVILGGNSDAALDRVVAYADGWYGFNLSRDELPERLRAFSSRCEQSGRGRATLEVAVSLQDGRPEDIDELGDLGVSEVVIVGSPPADPGESQSWVTALADRWSTTG